MTRGPANARVWGAEYRCEGCSREWTDFTGFTECPACDGLYHTWTNYESMRADRFRARGRPRDHRQR